MPLSDRELACIGTLFENLHKTLQGSPSTIPNCHVPIYLFLTLGSNIGKKNVVEFNADMIAS